MDFSLVSIIFHFFYVCGSWRLCKEALGLEPVGLSGGAARCFAPGQVLWARSSALDLLARPVNLCFARPVNSVFARPVCPLSETLKPPGHVSRETPGKS